VVVTDLIMPRLDGRQLVQRLRVMEQGPELRVVLVSASADLASVADELRVQACLTKPFDRGSLLRVVRHAMERGC
jgi:CheY-like chemotaxis protein